MAMRSLADPPVFRLAGRDGPRLDLEADGGVRAHVFVLEHDIIRVLVLPDGGLKFPRTWAIAPAMDDTAWEGRDRFEVAGFSCPEFDLTQDAEGLVVATSRLRLRVAWRSLRCRWDLREGEAWRPIAADRATQAYDFGWWDGKVRHYLKRNPGEAYYGLGERSGPLDRSGRRFRLKNVDALGYDAETSDPLYKHIPFYITRGGEAGPCFGLFYDTYSDCAFDFGCERSNYHGLFRSFEAQSGDLDYYVIAGPKPIDVTRRFTWLTGRPAATPDWILGYSGSSMAYADAPDAQDRLVGFLRDCEKHEIPCESFHLSSGYTSIGSKRCVFTWNRDKFPDPEGLARTFREAAVRILANIKPCLLVEHPDFTAVAQAGLFIGDEQGPNLVQFWDGLGAYLDFTNPAAVAWWQERLTSTLLDVGISAAWNDNNEFEVLSPRAQAAMFGSPRPAIEAKPLQTLLMMRASFEAQRAHAPDAPPIGISRSGAVGMHRYVQTWSGDNTTAWKTLRWNLRMGLGLSMSGVSNLGHDIGGFAGPAPDEELFVRWIGASIFQPRFSIHSWNDDGSVNEPWMHPAALPTIRELFALRRRFVPYLVERLRRYREDFEPVLRPLFFDFPDDPESWVEQDTHMVGPDILFAPPLDPGVETLDVRLPRGADWQDHWTGELLAGGQTVRRPCPWSRPPIFLRGDADTPIKSA
ncbi:MAG: glycoside hydrolase family 31 protein [Caulobacteraceae bacterium]|nr:glycoside hydrolase family 31 protein [Caulobacteraceae bacterium]